MEKTILLSQMFNEPFANLWPEQKPIDITYLCDAYKTNKHRIFSVLHEKIAKSCCFTINWWVFIHVINYYGTVEFEIIVSLSMLHS